MTRLARILAAALIVSASACGGVQAPAREGSATLERYGIAVSPPAGWHVRLTRATVEAATISLPSGREVSLGDADLLVRLFEYEPEPEFLSETKRTHPDGRPKPFAAAEFGLTELEGDKPKGAGFARRNFALAGRYFDLFVESGAARPPEGALASLNELVTSLEIRAGDFYPGTIEPPRFQPTAGWHVGSFGRGEIRAADTATAWAATVPYHNGPRDLPPAATLETLPPDGILIWVGLARDNRFPPTGELRRTDSRVSVPLQIGEAKGGFGWEGQVGEIALYRLCGLAGDQYHVDLWIFFGRREATPEQRERAQAMLDRLDLPDWGSWELDGQGVMGN